MSNALAIYLHDHLAGAGFAIDLLGALADQNADNPLGSFANELKAEIEKDRTVLQDLAERMGSVTPTIKEATAWAVEKASRFKLAWSADQALGKFEALEAISLGVLGKLALWRALLVIQPYDPHMSTVDFETLAARAQKQHAQVEDQRLQAALVALRQP